MQKAIVECCANSVSSALTAIQAGANRIELCKNLENGGETPDYSDILELRNLTNIDLHILILPKANNFIYSNKDFKNFTLWSQHLIMHTRESLYRFLQFVGFEQINITGVQRYPLSNHLNWLVNGRPGGHKSPLSIIDSNILNEEYENSLARIDATDTLVALAITP